MHTHTWAVGRRAFEKSRWLILNDIQNYQISPSRLLLSNYVGVVTEDLRVTFGKLAYI